MVARVTNQQGQQENRTEAPRRSTRLQGSTAPKMMKAAEVRALSTAEKLWAGSDVHKSLEMRAAEIAQDHEPEQPRKEEQKKANTFSLKSFGKAPEQTGSAPALRQPPAAFGKPSLAGPVPKPQVQTARNQPLGGVRQALLGELARAERPPDAYALLREAKESGVLFVEDSLKEGYSEEEEDPELAEAVEECIRLCFGVRGILRIGPGHNDRGEPIIVVAVTQGFTEASLAVVPPKVHRFATLIAIPFELLPLKRDR